MKVSFQIHAKKFCCPFVGCDRTFTSEFNLGLGGHIDWCKKNPDNMNDEIEDSSSSSSSSTKKNETENDMDDMDDMGDLGENMMDDIDEDIMDEDMVNDMEDDMKDAKQKDVIVIDEMIDNKSYSSSSRKSGKRSSSSSSSNNENVIIDSDEDEVEEQCTRKCGNCSICIMKLEADTTRERTMETTMGTTMETTTGNTVTEAPPDIGNGTMGMYDALRKDVVLDKNGLQPPLTAAGKRSQQNGEQNRTDRMLGCNKCQWKTEIGCKACRTYGGSLHPFDRKATKYWKQNAKDLILPRQLFNAVSMLGGYKRVFKCNLWDGE